MTFCRKVKTVLTNINNNGQEIHTRVNFIKQLASFMKQTKGNHDKRVGLLNKGKGGGGNPVATFLFSKVILKKYKD